MGAIYKIEDELLERIVYVGKATDFEARREQHRKDRYGDNKYEISIVKDGISDEDLADWEMCYVLTYRTHHPSYGDNQILPKDRLGKYIPDNRLSGPLAITPELIGCRVRYRWQKQHDWAQIEQIGVVKNIDQMYPGQSCPGRKYVVVFPLTPLTNKYLDGEWILPEDVLGLVPSNADLLVANSRSRHGRGDTEEA